MGLLGVHAILYALAGYAAGMFRRQLDSSKVSTQAIFTWMVSMVYFALYQVVERFFSVAEGSFQWALLTVPLMNAFLPRLSSWRWSAGRRHGTWNLRLGVLSGF